MVDSQAPTFPVLRAWPAGLAQPRLLPGEVGDSGLLPSEGDQPGENALEALQLGLRPWGLFTTPTLSKSLSLAKGTPSSPFFNFCATFLHLAQRGLVEEARFGSSTVPSTTV